MIYAKNLPIWERTLRLLFGAAIIVAGWLAAPSDTVLAVVMAVGATMILTSLFGFCPACALAGRRPLGRP